MRCRLPESVWVVFAIAVGVRVAAMVLLQSWQFAPAGNHWAAGWETGRIAYYLAEGQGFCLDQSWTGAEPIPTAWLAPLYPWLVAQVFGVCGNHTTSAYLVILVFQVIVSAATAALLVPIGNALGSRKMGMVAGLCLAVAPSSINMATRILWGTTLLTFELLVLILGFLRLKRESGMALAVGLGACIGVTLLTAPTPALFLGFATLWLLVRGRVTLGQVGMMVVFASLVVGPWVVRNHQTFGSWFFIKSNFQNELFIGNHGAATGRYANALSTANRSMSPATVAQLRGMNEVDRSSALGAVARRWIADNPGRFLQLTGVRVLGYWLSPFLTDWQVLPLGPARGVVRAAYRAVDLTVLVLALIGVFFARRLNPGWALLVGLLWIYPLTYYVTHSDITRYRFPVVPIVFLVAGAGVRVVFGRWWRADRRSQRSKVH